MSPNRSTRSLLQLDQDLAVAALADVYRRLDAAAIEVGHLARRRLDLDVLVVLSRRIRLRRRRDPIAFDLDDEIVELVPVHVGLGPWSEIELPDAHAVVFQEELGANVAEDA